MNYIRDLDIKDIAVLALKEDIGSKDITTELIIPKDKFVRAVLLAKEPCVICGLGVAALVFRMQDKNIKFKPQVKDGDCIKKGKIIARIYGRAKSILTAERVALNFLTLLSGISTATKKFTERVKPYKVNPVRKKGKKRIGFSNGVKIMDTRKTSPGLRIFQKYAVRIGGGFNHRLSLDEMIMVKDNHLKAIGGINKLTGFSRKYKAEIEVKKLREFKEALKLKPDIIMLDNMSIKDMQKAVKIRNSLSPNPYHLTPKLEASGGITLKNAKKVASTGVEMISIGALTHSVSSVDISLEIQ